MALCRCGESATKPFCDGAHAGKGFRGELRSSFPPTRDYTGRDVTVRYNRSICAHVGACTARLARVFDVEARPWIQPDGADRREVVDTVATCPSGALGVTDDEGRSDGLEGPPAIRTLADGPLAVTGHVELVGVEWADGASPEHYTLCRCGGSTSMPFCDGTHAARGFRDGPQPQPAAGASTKELDTVATSFRRSLADGRFADTFYEILLARAPDEIVRRFERTDFTTQKPLLRRAVDVMIRFGAGDDTATPEMERLAARHARGDLDIDRAYYTVWLDTLCETVGRHDPAFESALDAEWRERMRRGIDVMIARY